MDDIQTYKKYEETWRVMPENCKIKTENAEK